MGAGSARPVVSTTMRLNGETSPLARLRNSSLMVRHQVAAHRAAQAARVQRHHAFVVGLLDQQMVEADLAELVDDDGGVGQFRPAQQLVAAGWSCRCRGSPSARSRECAASAAFCGSLIETSCVRGSRPPEALDLP
jgi:hypothetical protein